MNIGGIRLNTPFLNAAGIASTHNQLTELEKLDWIGGTVSKSCTLSPSTGHPAPTYYYQSELRQSVNAVGLTNPGIDYYLQFKLTKPYIISCAVKYVNDLLWIEDKLLSVSQPPTAIELNISCPNTDRPVLIYDFQKLDLLLNKLKQMSRPCPIGLKIAPFIDTHALRVCRELITSKDTVDFVTCCNTLGNALVIKDSKTVLSAGRGGLGGAALKPFALAAVKEFSTYVDVIGCGGIFSIDDSNDYFLCGAKAVQIGTALREGSFVAKL